MAILLCFNNTLSSTLKDLQTITQLPEKELSKQVQSLIDAKLLMVSDTQPSEPPSPMIPATDNGNSNTSTETSATAKLATQTVNVKMNSN